MGLSQSIYTEIEIAAPPDTVRSVFLDFARYKQWHEIFTVTPVQADTQPIDLKPKDRVKVDIRGTGFTAIVMENSPHSFQWLGSLPWIFTGQHQFYFPHSDKTPAGTTLIQKEDFTGLLTFLLRPGWSFRKTTEDNFMTLNADLKKEAERIHQ